MEAYLQQIYPTLDHFLCLPRQLQNNLVHSARMQVCQGHRYRAVNISTCSSMFRVKMRTKQPPVVNIPEFCERAFQDLIFLHAEGETNESLSLHS